MPSIPCGVISHSTIGLGAVGDVVRRLQRALRRIPDLGSRSTVYSARSWSTASLEAAIAAFHRRHERLYTFAQDDGQLEALVAIAQARMPHHGALRAPGGNPRAAIVGHQRISFAEGRGDASIYDRARLGAGDRITARRSSPSSMPPPCCSSAKPPKSTRSAASSCTTDPRISCPLDQKSDSNGSQMSRPR
jgi:hypothetical protein